MAVSTITYSSSTSLTTTALASLASSSGLTAGWQTDIIDNRTTKYVDMTFAGKIRVGTTPTSGTQINIYVWGQTENGTPTRPDSFGTTQATRSITSAGVGQGYLRLLASLNVDSNTTGRDYWFGPVGVAQLFGGNMPQQLGLWIVHNTGVALDSTAGNHTLYWEGLKYDMT